MDVSSIVIASCKICYCTGLVAPDCYCSRFSPHPHTHLNCRPWSELVILVYFWLLFFIITDHVYTWLGRFDSRIYVHARKWRHKFAVSGYCRNILVVCARDSVHLRIAYFALVHYLGSLIRSDCSEAQLCEFLCLLHDIYCAISRGVGLHACSHT